MRTHCSIAVLGAGPAGLTAALFAATHRPTATILCLDHADTVAAKILISGGRRCNLTHRRVTPADYHGPARLVANILRTFDVPAVVQWFQSLGLALKTEPSGKIFPRSNRAADVHQALLTACRRAGISIHCGCHVQSIQATDRGLTVVHTAGRLTCQCLIMATGGCSLPRTGSDGSGWALAASLGHSVNPPRPALVPLVLDSTFFHAGLSGLSCPVAVEVRSAGRLIERRTGSMLFTHFGLSGPAILDISSRYLLTKSRNDQACLLVNFLPDQNFDTTQQWLVQTAATHARRSLARVIAQHLPHRLAHALLDHLGLNPACPIGQLTRLDRKRLVHGLTALTMPVTGHRGWNAAEVTAGGIPLVEVSPSTMASRCTAGLYLCGEMLDVDGRIGGFNFHWAWVTGRLAGLSAARALD